MSLLALHSADDTLRARLVGALPPHHDVATAGSWGRLSTLVRERPVAAVLVDADTLAGADELETAIGQLTTMRRDFPSVGLVVMARSNTPGELLFHLGSAGLADLRLVRIEEFGFRLTKEVNESLRWSAASRATQALAHRVPRRHLPLVRRVFETLHRRLSADQFARAVGTHRPQLSQALVAAGLPSVGRLLLWGRLLQAAVWLVEPGRTAESVSRQLEYSSGAAFRRMLRTRLGKTPTELVAAGGLPYVVDSFLHCCEGSEVPVTVVGERVAV